MYVNLVFRYVEASFVFLILACAYLSNNYASVTVLTCASVAFVCLHEVGEGEEEGWGGIPKLDLEE